MHSVDVRKIAKYDLLFDTYKVKIATLIYNFYNQTTPPCFEHLIQRKESYHDLRHQHHDRVQRFETYFVLKKTLSYRGSIVWNLLEPSAVSTWEYAVRVKKSPALRNLNFSKDSPQMGPQIDRDFVFYWFLYLLIFFCYPINIFPRPHELYLL